MFSTRGCTAFALGTVVITRSSSITLVVRFLKRLLRDPTSRLSFALPNLCLMIYLSQHFFTRTDRRPGSPRGWNQEEAAVVRSGARAHRVSCRATGPWFA